MKFRFIFKYLIGITCYILLNVSINSTLIAQTFDRTILDSLNTERSQLKYLSDVITASVYSSPKDALQYAMIFDSIASASNNDTSIYQAFNVKGMAYYANGQYDLSIENYVKALSIGDFGNLSWKAKLLNNLAVSYDITGNDEKSLSYYDEAISLYQELEDETALANTNANSGLMLLKYQRIDEAEIRLRKAVSYYEKSEDKVTYGYILLSLGNLLNEKKEYKESITSYQQSILYVPENINPLVSAAANSGIGVAYNRMGKSKLAEMFLLKGLAKAEAIQNTAQITECHRELSEVYEQRNAYDLALKHHKSFMGAKDSLFSMEQNNKMVEALTKYESDIKEKEIALLNSENEVANTKLQGIRRLAIVFGIGLAILSGLFYTLYKFNEKIKKTANEKDTLLREIHHRVKNNLQVISALLTLQSAYIKDDKAVEALRKGQDRVQSMALIHKDLYQHDNLKGVNTKDYLEKLIENLLESYKIEENNIQLNLDIENIWLDVDTMIPLGLMINEIISNTLKHAYKVQSNPTLSIFLKEVNNQLHLQISDNGVGINNIDDMETKSFGYSLIQSFAKKLDARLIYENDNGLTINLKINDYQKAG